MSDNNDDAQTAAAVLNPEIKAVTPPWLANTSKAMLPQGMPNQLNMLAANLAAGGFGTQPQNMTWLDQVYDPVEVTKFNQAPVKPVTKPVVTKPDVKKPGTAKVDDLKRRGYVVENNPTGIGTTWTRRFGSR